MTRISYSPKEAAQIAGCCLQSIYDALNAGKLPARKLGRRTMILHSDLEAFVADLDLYPAKKKTQGA